MQSRFAFLIATASLAAAFAVQAQDAPRVAASPFIPGYGEPVALELGDTSMQTYLPATRYVVSGNTIQIEYEFASGNVASPAMGRQPVQLGELAPGNYNVQARFYDINRPKASAERAESTLAVLPPQGWGVYTLPTLPTAYSPTSVIVRSAAYFDPGTMKARVAGNVVRVDFDYVSLPPGSDPPAGLSTFGTVKLPPAFAPGAYVLEGWGRTNGGTPEKFFTSDFIVTESSPVVEYYAPSIDHYFMTAKADEIAAIEAGKYGDWKRTGFTFNAFVRAEDAMPGAVPVCRFYASGPNSHFFTGSTQECESLKALEVTQREEARRAGKPFTAWAFEGIVFYALLPINGQCPSYAPVVDRFYNNRYAENDSNHRYTMDSQQRAAMTEGWLAEGAAFCSAP